MSYDATAQKLPNIPEAEEHEVAQKTSSYHRSIEKLNKISITTGFDPVKDVGWDHLGMEVDLSDERWIDSAQSNLTKTAWFQGLPKDKQINLALDIIAQRFGVGMHFENILQQGLLKFVNPLSVHEPEFRYIHHEVIEESRHTIMFKMFLDKINRDPGGIPSPWNKLVPWIVGLSTRFPELFFFFILGGEEPIDCFQRSSIKNKESMHPLLYRVMQIHVIEETRHIRFADSFLQQRLPHLSGIKRFMLSTRVPILLKIMIDVMLVPSKDIREAYGIPEDVMHEAYYGNPDFQKDLITCVSNTRRIVDKAGLLTPWSRKLWTHNKLMKA